jgi:hypothetical protein
VRIAESEDYAYLVVDLAPGLVLEVKMFECLQTIDTNV